MLKLSFSSTCQSRVARTTGGLSKLEAAVLREALHLAVDDVYSPVCYSSMSMAMDTLYSALQCYKGGQLRYNKRLGRLAKQVVRSHPQRIQELVLPPARRYFNAGVLIQRRPIQRAASAVGGLPCIGRGGRHIGLEQGRPQRRRDLLEGIQPNTGDGVRLGLDVKRHTAAGVSERRPISFSRARMTCARSVRPRPRDDARRLRIAEGLTAAAAPPAASLCPRGRLGEAPARK